jgi:hypothetical protein
MTKQAINYIITGIIFVEAETYDEAVDVLEESSLEEIIDDSEGYSVAYQDVPFYEH